MTDIANYDFVVIDPLFGDSDYYGQHFSVLHGHRVVIEDAFRHLRAMRRDADQMIKGDYVQPDEDPGSTASRLTATKLCEICRRYPVLRDPITKRRLD